jgi:hypothetical protein
MNGQNYGPYPAPTLQAMIPTGQFTVSSMVWREGMAAWAAAASVPELAALIIAMEMRPEKDEIPQLLRGGPEGRFI